jgi:PAS domain S-box-containing protein
VDRASGDGGGRRLEEALRKSEERFRRLVEAAKDYAIFMTDAEGRVSTWNEGAERLFGYEEGEIVGEDGSVLFVPEDREGGAPEREQEKARTEGRAEDERWHLRKDGTRFWASGFVRPILDGEGDLIGFSKVARDLTERRRAEEAVDEVRWAERDRLARDLHDLVLQDLVYALQAWEARRLAPREAEEDVFDPRQMAASLRRASQGVRQAIHELRAGETVGRALARAVEDLVGSSAAARRGPTWSLPSRKGSPRSCPRRCARTCCSW